MSVFKERVGCSKVRHKCPGRTFLIWMWLYIEELPCFLPTTTFYPGLLVFECLKWHVTANMWEWPIITCQISGPSQSSHERFKVYGGLCLSLRNFFLKLATKIISLCGDSQYSLFLLDLQRPVFVKSIVRGCCSAHCFDLCISRKI